MIGLLIGLSVGLAYLWLGARYGATLYVQRKIDREVNEVLAVALAKYGEGRTIPISKKNDLAIEEMRRSAAVKGMWLTPFWPFYVGAVKGHGFIVKNSHTTDYDRRKREKEQEERAKDLQNRIDELEKQEAKWQETSGAQA